MRGLTSYQIKTLYILANGEQPSEKDLTDALHMDEANFRKNVRIPLMKKQLCHFGMLIKSHKQGRPYKPIIIQDTDHIEETILDQIEIYRDKANWAAKTLRKEAARNPSSKNVDKLSKEHLKHVEVLGQILEFVKIPVYKDRIAKILALEGHSSEHIIDRLIQDIDIIANPNLIGDNPMKRNSDKAFHENCVAREKYYEKFDKNLQYLEADPIACKCIKELWNNNSNMSYFAFVKSIGYPFDVVDAEIKKMLMCNEIAFTSKQMNRIKWL